MSPALGARGLATTCTALKDPTPAPLPAWRRYQGPRVAHVRSEAARRGLKAFILSGQLGFLSLDEPVPYYDHLLLDGEVAALLPKVKAQLENQGLESLEFLHRPLAQDPLLAPYLRLMREACALAGVTLCLVELKDLPGRD
jgi:hypothetical protein